MSSRRILITGVSRGLGRALLEPFVAGGHTVIGCARNTGAIAELRDQYGAAPGAAGSRFDVVDVADDASVAAWSESVLSDGGPPDLLLNNAALINESAPLWNVPPEEFSRLVDVNIKGIYHVIRHFVPAMIDQGRGVIVNYSSSWGRAASPDVAPYCATKWAVEGLTRALAEELPAGMAAVPLNPGIINTDMLQVCFGEGAAAYPTAERWAQKAAKFLLELDNTHNGLPLTAPG